MTEQVTTVAAISSAVVLLGAYLYSTSGPKSKNPFASDTRETSKPFENDKRKRDEVLKNGYTAKKFEDSLKDGKEYDAIFIGSGMYIRQHYCMTTTCSLNVVSGFRHWVFGCSSYHGSSRQKGTCVGAT